MSTLETERLILRRWKAVDFDAFVKLNSDPEVMRFFPNMLTPLQSIELARHLAQQLFHQQWGMWAVELKESGDFIGMLGLQPRVASDGILDNDFVEIAWRLSRESWGNGFASEAAAEVLRFSFTELELESVYSLTALRNKPSQRVMQKIGMQNLNQDFQHPRLEPDSPLSWHCLYQITRQAWLASNK